MGDTVVTTETAPAEPVKNEAPAATTPTVTQAELDEIKRQKDQAEMRARQLENEKVEREKREEEARRKKMEEDGEYKTLLERTTQELEALKAEREAEAKKSEISSAEFTILNGYTSEVRDAAKELGISLTDDTEESKQAFQARLDVIKGRFGEEQQPKIQGNNQPPMQTPTNLEERAKLVSAARFSPDASMQVIGSLDAIKEMRKQAGVSE